MFHWGFNKFYVVRAGFQKKSTEGTEANLPSGNAFTKQAWWFQKDFVFLPLPGEMIQFDKYFSVETSHQKLYR